VCKLNYEQLLTIARKEKFFGDWFQTDCENLNIAIYNDYSKIKTYQVNVILETSILLDGYNNFLMADIPPGKYMIQLRASL